jgi:hypothetical protein
MPLEEENKTLKKENADLLLKKRSLESTCSEYEALKQEYKLQKLASERKIYLLQRKVRDLESESKRLLTSEETIKEIRQLVNKSFVVQARQSSPIMMEEEMNALFSDERPFPDEKRPLLDEGTVRISDEGTAHLSDDEVALVFDLIKFDNSRENYTQAD